MSNSMNLITAHIAFLPGRVVLVHIPNEYFSFFLQPLLKILFGEDLDDLNPELPWTYRHDFLNFSVTPIGCTLICSRTLVDRFLAPLADQFNELLGHSRNSTPVIEISHEDYVVVQVDGQGLNASERVLELTAPLAMAGISIFFITTYFSDYILVPSRSRRTVVTTLQQQGFVFSDEAEAYVSQLSPIFTHGTSSPNRPQTASSSGSETFRPHAASVPSTPLAKDVPELQIRTFTKLLNNKIEPLVDPGLRLINCAAGREFNSRDLDKLKNDLLQILLATNGRAGKRQKTSTNGLQMQNLSLLSQDEDDSPDFSASFLSITLTEEPVSILLEERLLLNTRLGSNLLASRDEEEVLLPITLDLRSLGWRATGIVGGVAGRLSQGAISPVSGLELEGPQNGTNEEAIEDEPIEISFLSSAKAGSVIVRANQLKQALNALRMGMEECGSGHVIGVDIEGQEVPFTLHHPYEYPAKLKWCITNL